MRGHKRPGSAGPPAPRRTLFLPSWKNQVALSRGTLHVSVLKRGLYIICTSRERDVAISVQWCYLLEALAFSEEEKIATCFLRRMFPVNRTW